MANRIGEGHRAFAHPPAEGGEARGLALQSRRWWSGSEPFKYLRAHDVFAQETYHALARAFAKLLSLGTSEVPVPDRFCRSIPGYDSYALGFPSRMTGPLEVFQSRAFHDLVARLIGVDATGDFNGGLHHHATGSQSGHPHNDLNPGYFVDSPRSDGINPSDETLCSYTQGCTNRPLPVRETVRAVAVIYYLCNQPWVPGDGGETALYLRTAAGFDPIVLIPPIDNSLLIFECTPDSYHGFMANVRRPRNSAILWLHRLKSDAVARWGKGSVVEWPAR